MVGGRVVGCGWVVRCWYNVLFCMYIVQWSAPDTHLFHTPFSHPFYTHFIHTPYFTHHLYIHTPLGLLYKDMYVADLVGTQVELRTLQVRSVYSTNVLHGQYVCLGGALRGECVHVWRHTDMLDTHTYTRSGPLG